MLTIATYIVATSLVLLIPLESVIKHLICQPFHLPTVFVILDSVADWKLVHTALGLLLYCHWYFKSSPCATTFHVACFPSATVISEG